MPANYKLNCLRSHSTTQSAMDCSGQCIRWLTRNEWEILHCIVLQLVNGRCDSINHPDKSLIRRVMLGLRQRTKCVQKSRQTRPIFMGNGDKF